MNNRPNNNRGFSNNNPSQPSPAQRANKAKEKLPYGFIPVKDNPPELVEAADFGACDPKLYTGYINCSLHALNELCVGNRHVDLGNDTTEIQPMEVGGNILISASTLKGCMANFLAAYLGLPISRLNEHRYSFRPNNAFATDPKILNGAGLVQKINDDGSLEIRKFRANKFAFSRYEERDGQHNYSDTDRNGRPQNKYSINSSGTQNANFKFYPYHDGIDGEGSLGERFTPRVSHKSFGVITGGPGAEPLFEPKPYIISADTMKAYTETQIKVLASDKTGHFTDHPMADKIKDVKDKILSNIKVNAPVNVGEVVFFEYRNNSLQILTFGKHFRYRWAYSRSLRDFTKDYQEYDQEALAKGRVNLIEELFGYSCENKEIPYQHRSKSGKVHFSYAVHEKGTGALKEEKWLPRPGSPKPSSYEFYLRQAGSDQKPLTTFGDPARADFAQAPRLSGHKMYYRTKTTPYNDHKQEEGVDKTVKLVKVLYPKDGNHPTFKFRVNYENLTGNELRLLYFALCLGQNTPPNAVAPDQMKDLLCHQIGYGKNYGMGAVKITVERKNNQEELYSVKTDPETGALKHVLLSFSSFPAISDKMRQLLLVHDLPRKYPVNEKGEIHSWHTKLKNDDLKNRRS